MNVLSTLTRCAAFASEVVASKARAGNAVTMRSAIVERCESRQLFTVSFAEAVLYNLPASDDSSAVVTADFTGDGNLDAAALNPAADSIYIAPGNGDGTFGSILTTAVDDSAQDMAVGDFNGDGKADLAVAIAGSIGPTNDDEVHVFIGNGDGTFAAPIVNSAAGIGGVDIAAGDLTGDGKADVVVGDALLENELGVLLNTGTGTLGAIVTYDVDHASRDIVLADLNNDAKLDIAAGLDDGFGATLLNDGSGAFAEANVFQIAASDSTRVEGIMVANVAGDTNLDLIVMSEDGEGFATLTGNGNGTFGAITQKDDGTRDDGVAADFDGDGDIDVVTTDGVGGQFEAYTRADDASFQRTMFDFAGEDTLYIASGDFNGDEKLDVVTTGERPSGEGGDGFLAVFLNTSDGTSPPPGPPSTAVDLAASELAVTHRGASVIGGSGKGAAKVKVSNASTARFNGDANISFYASSDGLVDSGDTLITSVDRTLNIRGGKAKAVRTGFVFPTVADGSYTILAKVTAASDTQVANDVATATDPVVISGPSVDLAAQSLVVKVKGPAAVAGANTATVFKFKNDGNTTHDGDVSVNYYLSSDSAVDPSDTLIGTLARSVTVRSGGARTLRSVFQLPSVPSGIYTVLAEIAPVSGETVIDNGVAADATGVTFV